MSNPAKEATGKTRKSLITPVSIISYPSLDQARASDDDPNAKPKFGAAFVFTVEAQGTQQYKAIQQAVIAAAMAALPGKSQQEIIELFKLGVEGGGIRTPFRRNWEAKKYPEGSVYINARSTNRPGCVLADLSPVPLDRVKEVFYAGAWVKASLGPYFYNHKGNKGVSLGLNNVQFIRDGERLDNRAKAEEEFTADMSTEPAAMDDLI